MFVSINFSIFFRWIFLYLIKVFSWQEHGLADSKNFKKKTFFKNREKTTFPKNVDKFCLNPNFYIKIRQNLKK